MYSVFCILYPIAYRSRARSSRMKSRARARSHRTAARTRGGGMASTLRVFLHSLLVMLPLVAHGCIDGGKNVACCVDPVPANNCSACLKTTDQRAAWGSKCVWLSAVSTTSPQRCQPSKWWGSADSKPDKKAGIHVCTTCGACAPPPPPIVPAPPPPVCTPQTAPRAACWPGTWTSAPTHTPDTAVVDGPIVGNGVMSSVQTIGTCGPVR
eukprot:COSAG02_NODE_1522_length_12158_cov_23.675263_6_plen_210_part_00